MTKPGQTPYPNDNDKHGTNVNLIRTLENNDMAWKQVIKYWLGYNIDQKQFLFYYQLDGEATINQIKPSAADFAGLADMFRNEGPIHFETTGRYFTTAAEDVGEGE